MSAIQDALIPQQTEEFEDPIAASHTEIAEYVKDMVGQLERLAGGRDFERLRDLLRLARDEAHRHAGRRRS